jgi:hypothetical protein
MPRYTAAESTIIRATSGYELLLATSESDAEFSFFRAPIIAWRISHTYSMPEAITVGGDEDLNQLQAILLPDGKVEYQEMRTFDNLEEWVKYAREQHESHKTGTVFATRACRPNKVVF